MVEVIRVVLYIYFIDIALYYTDILTWLVCRSYIHAISDSTKVFRIGYFPSILLCCHQYFSNFEPIFCHFLFDPCPNRVIIYYRHMPLVSIQLLQWNNNKPTIQIRSNGNNRAPLNDVWLFFSNVIFAFEPTPIQWFNFLVTGDLSLFSFPQVLNSTLYVYFTVLGLLYTALCQQGRWWGTRKFISHHVVKDGWVVEKKSTLLKTHLFNARQSFLISRGLAECLPVHWADAGLLYLYLPTSLACTPLSNNAFCPLASKSYLEAQATYSNLT